VATPAELFARPASLAVARFLGMPNQLPGTVHENGTFRSAQGEFRVGAGHMAGPAVAVFRSDALRPDASGELRGRVLSLLHRSHQTAALVDVGGVRLEAAVDPLDQPSAGAAITLSLDARRVVVFPA
jgi:putative spermidine/putrescine transport system ATP-binding protein